MSFGGRLVVELKHASAVCYHIEVGPSARRLPGRRPATVPPERRYLRYPVPRTPPLEPVRRAIARKGAVLVRRDFNHLLCEPRAAFHARRALVAVRRQPQGRPTVPARQGSNPSPAPRPEGQQAPERPPKRFTQSPNRGWTIGNLHSPMRLSGQQQAPLSRRVGARRIHPSTSGSCATGSYKSTISTSIVARSRIPTVDRPVTHPPASPGFTISVSPGRTSTSWVCP